MLSSPNYHEIIKHHLGPNGSTSLDTNGLFHMRALKSTKLLRSKSLQNILLNSKLAAKDIDRECVVIQWDYCSLRR